MNLNFMIVATRKLRMKTKMQVIPIKRRFPAMELI